MSAGDRRAAPHVGLHRGQPGGVRGFGDTTPLVEGLSIDEAFLDVGGMQRIFGTPVEIAARLRRSVRERVGLPITVGVARTKFLAKVASGVAKPDGLLVVPPDRELAFLHPLPVERLWGVGQVTAEQLHRSGVQTVADVARLGEPRWWSCWAGRPDATSTRWRTTAIRARCRPGGAGGRSAPSAHWAARRRSAEALDATLVGLVDRVTGRMRVAGRVGRTVILRLRFDDFSRATRSHTLSGRLPTASRSWPPPGAVRDAAPIVAARGLTLVGVAVTNLQNADAVQLDAALRPAPADALDLALDEVRARFGSSAITRAVLVGRDRGLVMPLLPD